ncbi:uncharacterized protein Eint_040500 [Encephalitozoon intestinalis ATCC 50506]|uniref:Uncharacterized protein n=1 Tax=Encephalitozoon intestinalis (strain ATCC 50506) TaxID=876142 RepID=E0S6K5_ENCIT|nr:uncharacterized protein Eint_040500 [Encephalitozoon intestinalis ATCC 50506]ADM11340.1 hypothetical protein Eint_040500 [Encephalitozoon intestinalis ATCC 50506]UTX45028.1 hypothetical protein GPK93_04g05650 [Encephalitozoon intestinalis]
MKSRERVLEDIRNRLRTLLSSRKCIGMESIRDDFFFMITNPKIFDELVMEPVFSCNKYWEFKRLMYLCGYSHINRCMFMKGGEKEGRAPSILLKRPEEKDLLRFEEALEDLRKKYLDLEEILDDVWDRLDNIDGALERSMGAIRDVFNKGAEVSGVDLQEINGLVDSLMKYDESESMDTFSEGATPEESDIEAFSSSSEEGHTKVLENKEKKISFF